MSVHEQYEHQILDAIERAPAVSQRSLASSLGIALGLTNLLIRNLAHKGWIRVSRVQPNRVRYFLTPAGVAEKTRMSANALQDAISRYATARDRIRESLTRVGAPDTRIVFYGVTDIAEIAYVCLRETDLQLVGVVPVGEIASVRPFFGVPVRSCDDIRDGYLGDIPFDRIVVTSFVNQDASRARLIERGVSPERVHWL